MVTLTSDGKGSEGPAATLRDLDPDPRPTDEEMDGIVQQLLGAQRK